MLSPSDPELVPMSQALLAALLDDDRTRAERELGARIHEAWSLPHEVLAMRMRQLQADPSWQPWLLQALITRDAQPTLIGNVGFHGPPGRHVLEPRYPSIVEIGYDVVPEHRRKGFASRAVGELIAWARQHGAGYVAITTAPSNLASRRIAERLGCALVEEHHHPARGHELLYVKSLDPGSG